MNRQKTTVVFNRIANRLKLNESQKRKYKSKLIRLIKEEQEEKKQFGFAIDVGNEDLIESFAEEDGIELDDKAWDTLNKDFSKIEKNIMNWMNKNGSASDHGHSGSELVGVFFPNDKVLEDVEDSVGDEPFMTTSGTFSDLIPDNVAFRGTSKLSNLIDINLEFTEV